MKNKLSKRRIITGLGFLVFILLTIHLTVRQLQQEQGIQAGARGRIRSHVRLLTSDSYFKKRRTTLLDFSLVSGSRTLSDEYADTAGVVFDNLLSAGWATYQANGFANHLSTAVKEPGAPAGITGTRFTLSKETRLVGMYIQSGSPFNLNSDRPAKTITLRAYDSSDNKLFEKVTDTCLRQSESCMPSFIGVISSRPIIRKLEIIINDAYSWSIDDIKWEQSIPDFSFPR